MNFSFILVEPKVPENIGASARALKTMGFSTMVLVNPCPDPDGKASWVAHGSADILDSASIFDSLEEALAGYDLIIATTARKRWLKKDAIKSDKLYRFLEQKGASSGNIAIVFGREESGLTNSEMELCDLATTIPLKSSYPSLNLSQAVMIYAYELARLPDLSVSTHSKGDNLSSFRALKDKTKELLRLTGISENPVLSGRVLERISHAADKDIKLMHTLSSAIIEKLNKEQNDNQ